jgi:hypothetical protein
MLLLLLLLLLIQHCCTWPADTWYHFSLTHAHVIHWRQVQTKHPPAIMTRA